MPPAATTSPGPGVNSPSKPGSRPWCTCAPAGPPRSRGTVPHAFLWLGIAEEGDAAPADRWLAGQFVADCLQAGSKVLLHSSLGRHRTRWVYVAWAIVDGRSAQAALRQAGAKPWLSPYHTSPELWDAFARDVRRGRRGAPAGLAGD